jgi:hypothetical protein
MLSYQLIEACGSLRAHLGFRATMAEAVPVLTR